MPSAESIASFSNALERLVTLANDYMKDCEKEEKAFKLREEKWKEQSAAHERFDRQLEALNNTFSGDNGLEIRDKIEEAKRELDRFDKWAKDAAEEYDSIAADKYADAAELWKAQGEFGGAMGDLARP